MMVLVALIGVATVGLFRPSRLGAASAFGLTFFALAATTLSVILARPNPRPFALGFSFGGWASLLLHFGALFPMLTPPASGGMFGQTSASILPTTAFLDLIYPRLFTDTYQPIPLTIAPGPYPQLVSASTGKIAPSLSTASQGTIAIPPPMPAPSSFSMTIAMPPPPVSTSYTYWTESDRAISTMTPMRSVSFMTIGYSIFTWIFAFFGGCWASWLASKKNATAADSPS
jgi:hypothetical protein